MTTAFNELRSTFRNLLHLMCHYSQLILYTDHDRRHYSEFLAKTTEPLRKDNEDFFIKFFVRDIVSPEKSASLIYEMMYTRMVDAYLLYISSVLRLVFIAEPRTLISDETVTIRTVLEHKSIDEFIEAYADKKVASLSYKSLNNLSEFFQRRLGVDLASEKHSLKELNEYVMTRNVLVHNQGIVNELFVSITNTGVVGERVKIGDKQAGLAILILDEAAEHLDKLLVEKFSLPSVRPIQDQSASLIFFP